MANRIDLPHGLLIIQSSKNLYNNSIYKIFIFVQVKVQWNVNFIGSLLIMDHWTQVIKFSLVFNYGTIF